MFIWGNEMYDVAKVRYHDIDFEKDEFEYYTWSKVRPGDLVHSPGTRAYKANQFVARDDNTKQLTLAHKLLVVLSRHEGVPGEEANYDKKDFVTFTAFSRHGPLIIIKYSHWCGKGP